MILRAGIARLPVTLVLVGLVVFLQSVLVVAEDSATTDDLERSATAFPVPEILVIGRSRDILPTLVVRDVSTEDIDAYSAYTIGDALTPVPGVNVQFGGTSGDARAWIRGFRDRDSLVLFDGIPIASGFEGTIDLNEIATEHVAGIRVIKGAPSVIYGVNGMGGVIDVLPRNGTEAGMLSTEVVIGSNGRQRLRASSGGGSDDLSYLLSVSHDQAENYALSDDYAGALNQPVGDRVNSDFERKNLFLFLDSKQTPIGHSSFFYNVSDAEKGLTPTAGDDDPDFERLTRSTRQTVGLSNLFDTIPLAAKVYYNAYESDLTVYTDETYSEIDEIGTGEDYSYGAKFYSTLETHANNNLILHAAGQTDIFKGEGELEDGNKAELTTWTLAVEDQFWITRKLSVAVGGIFNKFDQTRLGRSSTAFSPQIAVAWQATENLALHSSAARRTRLPKLRELYRRRYGNPDLKEQTADNYELGLSYRHTPTYASDVALFYSDVNGLIERPDRRSLYLNLEPLQIKGVEMSTAGWVSDDLYTRLSYTYVSVDEAAPGGGTRQLRSRPKNTAQLEMRYRFPREIEVAVNGIYVSGLHDLDADGVHTELDSYFIANLKVSRDISDQLAVYLTAANLADTDYSHRIGDPRQGRTLQLGVKFEY